MVAQTLQNTTNGILLIDKPVDWTSHDVVGFIRKKYFLTKVGHTGTLDPFATGLLIIAIGAATRLIEYTHVWPKTYLTTLTLGATSTTDDSTGNLTPTNHQIQPTREHLHQTLPNFLGPQQQLPPAYAAIKIQGKKLYEYARRGERVERTPRAITIYDSTLIRYNYPKITLEITCSTGTYIRSFGRDLGAALQTGAYVSQLRRTRIGKFHMDQANTIHKLSTDSLFTHLLPMDSLIHHLPRYTIRTDNVAQFKKGNRIYIPREELLSQQPIAIYSPPTPNSSDKSLLCGIATYNAATSLLQPQKVLI